MYKQREASNLVKLLENQAKLSHGWLHQKQTNANFANSFFIIVRTFVNMIRFVLNHIFIRSIKSKRFLDLKDKEMTVIWISSC